MKRLAMAWVAAAAMCIGAATTNAQNARPMPVDGGVSRLTAPVEAYTGGSAPFIFANTHPRFSTFGMDSALGYFNNDGSFTLWPVGDTIMDPQTQSPRLDPNNSPFVRLMNLERFDAPGSAPLLDSVHMTFVIDSIGTGTGNKFTVEVMDNIYGKYTDGNGNSYNWPVPWLVSMPLRQNGQKASVSLGLTGTSKLHAHQIIDTTIVWKSPVVLNVNDTLGDLKGTFCVGLNSYNFSNGNRFRMFADSNYEQAPGRLIDPAVDRMYWLALSTDQQYFIRDFWGGHYYTDGTTQESILYPNFIMIAYTHDANAAVTPAGGPTTHLWQTYPNPVATACDISYELAQAGPVSLKVYNALGIEVASVVDGPQAAGNHQVTFNASNLPNGTYFYKLTSGEFTATKNLIVSH